MSFCRRDGVRTAVEVGKRAGMPIAPIMIYGDDVGYVVTEEGIPCLYKAQGREERRRALASETAELPKAAIVIRKTSASSGWRPSARSWPPGAWPPATAQLAALCRWALIAEEELSPQPGFRTPEAVAIFG